jgi:hypothetical protein
VCRLSHLSSRELLGGQTNLVSKQLASIRETSLEQISLPPRGEPFRLPSPLLPSPFQGKEKSSSGSSHQLSEDWESSLSRLGLSRILSNPLVTEHNEVLKEVWSLTSLPHLLLTSPRVSSVPLSCLRSSLGFRSGGHDSDKPPLSSSPLCLNRRISLVGELELGTVGVVVVEDLGKGKKEKRVVTQTM